MFNSGKVLSCKYDFRVHMESAQVSLISSRSDAFRVGWGLLMSEARLRGSDGIYVI